MKYYPTSAAPAQIAEQVLATFRNHESELSSRALSKANRPSSDEVLEMVRPALEDVGFQIEGGEQGKIRRTVLEETPGQPMKQVEVDGYHPESKGVLEVESGRGGESNAVHRDLIRGMAMEDTDIMIIAVLNQYKHGSGRIARHFDRADKTIQSLYSASQVQMPFEVALIGY
jgi:hypothetical protein